MGSTVDHEYFIPMQSTRKAQQRMLAVSFVYFMPRIMVGVREARILAVLNVLYFTTFFFCMVHILLQSQNHKRVSKGRRLLRYVHKQPRCILDSESFFEYFVMFYFVIYIHIHMQVL